MKSPASLVVAALSGLLFAVGLGVSGMARPEKVVGFLDVAGAWDPSLMLVMGGGLTVFAVAYRLAMRRRAPLYADGYSVPEELPVDARLVGGSVLFGVGWGLAGYCPGPALLSLVTLAPSTLIFVSAMAAGMVLFDWLDARTRDAAEVVPMQCAGE